MSAVLTTAWTPVTSIDNIPPREGRAVTVDGVEVAIFNVNGRFLTIENECPHKGGPLCDGIVNGTTVVCPLHGQKFDLESGMPVMASQASCVATYPTRVVDGVINVNVAAGRKLCEE